MTLSILDQYNRFCESDGEGEIICPHCRKEIGQWDESERYLKKGLCLFCDCEGIHEYDNVDEYEWYDRCDECHRKKDCEQALWDDHCAYVERHRALLHYQCTGGLSHAELTRTGSWC